MSKLSGLVCMVTGGASGLGRATVENFLKQGCKVVVCDLPNSGGDKLEKELNTKNVIFSPTDVTSEADVTKALQAAKSNYGRLNVLVNCAGIGVAYRTYNFNKKTSHSLQDFQKVININLVGTKLYFWFVFLNLFLIVIVVMWQKFGQCFILRFICLFFRLKFGFEDF